MTSVKFYATVDNALLKFAVIIAKHNKYLFVKYLQSAKTGLDRTAKSCFSYLTNYFICIKFR